jgi:hypothetical protein
LGVAIPAADGVQLTLQHQQYLLLMERQLHPQLQRDSVLISHSRQQNTMPELSAVHLMVSMQYSRRLRLFSQCNWVQAATTLPPLYCHMCVPRCTSRYNIILMLMAARDYSCIWIPAA